MKAKLARAGAAALLILVMAVTPLSAFLNGGLFDVRLPGWDGVTATHVLFEDHTGLVKAVAPAYPDRIDDGITVTGRDRLLVQWMGGCDDPLTVLTFDRTDGGYRIVERTEHRCVLMIGIGRAVAVSLWSPIDATAVTFMPHD